jgi:hypothetical protein
MLTAADGPPSRPTTGAGSPVPASLLAAGVRYAQLVSERRSE